MFAQLENRTYFLFAGLNLLWMPIVFFFYPETKDRSLESESRPRGSECFDLETLLTG